MEKEIILNNIRVKFTLEYKNVKNINLRIKSDGKVFVSVNKYMPQKVIDEFLYSKSDFILKAIKKLENKANKPLKQYFKEDELCDAIFNMCNKIYPYYEKYGIEYPQIKFRKMISQWGNCRPQKGILTFNINLMYAPPECVAYVVLHEFTHFLEANHSEKFYFELQKVCPNWKNLKNKLRYIYF